MIYKNKTVGATYLYKWIGKTIGVDDMIVRDVIYCLSDAIKIAISQGYDLNVPRVGTFTSNIKNGKDIGDTTVFGYNGNSEDVMKNTDDFKTEYDKENNKYIRTYLKKQPNFRSVKFKISPALKENVKQESMEYLNDGTY